jgi:hypothetical protein
MAVNRDLETKTPTQYFALAAGIIYLLVGLMGFVPALVTQVPPPPDLAVHSGYGHLMGLFPINILHNIVHLAVGVLGILAFRSHSGSRTFSRGLAIFYGLLAIMGLVPLMNTTFGLIPIFSHDVWLHAATALVAAYFGFMAPASVPTTSTAGGRRVGVYDQGDR